MGRNEGGNEGGREEGRVKKKTTQSKNKTRRTSEYSDMPLCSLPYLCNSVAGLNPKAQVTAELIHNEESLIRLLSKTA